MIIGLGESIVNKYKRKGEGDFSFINHQNNYMSKVPKILVVGSFVMDLISSTKSFPESGQTVLGYQFTTAPGGKGANQAMEAALLGADVTMIGKVGNDVFGDRLITSLKDAGVNVDHVLRDENGISSAVGNIILTTTDNGTALNNRIIVIPGANMEITQRDVFFLKDTIDQYDMVILQLEIPMEINQLVAQYAHDKEVPVMLNPAPIAPIPKELMDNITYLSPNETEAERLLGCFIRKDGEEITDEAISGIMSAMSQKGIRKILLTLGNAGAIVIENGNVMASPAVKGIEAIDPTAAGDSFVAAFCTSLCSGLNEQEALEFANMIAAVTVSGMGAQPSLPTLQKAFEFHKNAGRDISILEKFDNKISNRVKE